MIKISHGTQYQELEQSTANGYGYASQNMLDSLARVGYEVNQNDPTADVEIWFDQPQHWRWSKNTYRIGYHPWESTRLLSQEWADAMNECDEVWTPSPLIADWYTRFAGIKVPVYVYEHGVSPDWTPVERKVEDNFKFLHVGGQAARKGMREAMKGLRLAFPNNEPVELTCKIMSEGWNLGKLNRVTYINEAYSLPRLIQLFHDHHAYVYPSWGEGFGLTPLQALATGMPTITLPSWAPYSQFLDDNLAVKSRITKSPWPGLHPGNMLEPNLDSIIDAMRYTYANYDEVSSSAMRRTLDLAEHYSWDRLTAEAFGNLEKRLESS